MTHYIKSPKGHWGTIKVGEQMVPHHYKAGEAYTPKPEELVAFPHVFASRVEMDTVEPPVGGAGDGGEITAEEVASATVSELIASVEEGAFTAEKIIELETGEGGRNRATLLAALEPKVGG